MKNLFLVIGGVSVSTILFLVLLPFILIILLFKFILKKIKPIIG